MSFCTDTDLLYWEPNLLKDAAFASQTLISGTANLAGSTLTISAGSLATNHVEAGQVVVLAGAVAGSFPIASVDSATQLTLSVLYDGLYPDEGAGAASPVGTATGLTYVIRTFWPQRRIVSDLIQQAAGLGTGESAAAVVKNPLMLRRACALGTLQMVYSALAAAAPNPGVYTILNGQATLYERLYQRALRSAKVELDLDGDGVAETVRALNVMDLQRG